MPTIRCWVACRSAGSDDPRRLMIGAAHLGQTGEQRGPRHQTPDRLRCAMNRIVGVHPPSPCHSSGSAYQIAATVLSGPVTSSTETGGKAYRVSRADLFVRPGNCPASSSSRRIALEVDPRRTLDVKSAGNVALRGLRAGFCAIHCRMASLVGIWLIGREITWAGSRKKGASCPHAMRVPPGYFRTKEVAVQAKKSRRMRP
jgi:hypothetical protein